MRCRTGFAWALIICGVGLGCVGLASLLALACQPGFTATAPAGMSAPLGPASAIESTPAAQLLRVQFDWHGLALRASGFSFAPGTVCSTKGTRPDAAAIPPHYGPLHRRPPPSFS